MNWCERAVGKLLTETAQPGDIVMFPEISRMARSTLQVLEMLEHCARCGITVHVAKQKMVLDGSMQSHITATVLGWPLRSSGSSSPCALRRPWRGARLKGWPRSAER